MFHGKLGYWKKMAQYVLIMIYEHITKCAIIYSKEVDKLKASGIRQLRIRAKLDTSMAIEKLGISKSMLYKIEQGDRSPSKSLIMVMSGVYKCSIEDVFNTLNF